MSNQDRVIEVMMDANEGFTEGDVSRMAVALADAGLLMPEGMETQFGVEIFVNGEWEHHIDILSNEVWDADQKFAEDTLDYFEGMGQAARLMKRHVSSSEVSQ
ncbi:hypothetical protein phi16_gp089 [Corynebacterium phage phi16]|uniref:hypothetical protein n=1 Tax=Corynebacterium glutamicum TaxID=1718 RepID=UPI00094247BE|nr:hypothetical protein [Corynebacterium glutamicum]APQ42592.1 hypothetical protein phi16_gp089 [Corynebacterium phage phi16]OKX80507.1 hypothetical protein AUO95_10195 [Corynebacterium glutamicum]